MKRDLVDTNVLSVVRRYKMVDQAYDILKARIIKGKLTPGQEISVNELTKRLNTSRTPIREALGRLKGEGLVVDMDKGKMSVIKLSSKEIAQICELRASLETLALKWGFENIPREKVQENLRMLKEAKKNLEKGDPEYFYKVDTILHNLIVTSADNQWLVKMISQLRNIIEITRNMFTSIKRHGESLQEHIIIVESLLKGSKEATIKNVNLHIDHAKNHLLYQMLHQKEEINKTKAY